MRAAAAAVTEQTLSMMEATGLSADMVDEETGWIVDEVWDIASKEEQAILWEQTQAVTRRRRDRDRERGQAAGEGAGGAAQTADGAEGGPEAAGGDAADDYQRQRMLRCLDVMELKVADLQRQITFLRRQMQ